MGCGRKWAEEQYDLAIDFEKRVKADATLSKLLEQHKQTKQIIDNSPTTRDQRDRLQRICAELEVLLGWSERGSYEHSKK